MAARSKKPIHDMVAWYNATPNWAGVILVFTVFAQRRRLPLPIDFAVRPQNDDKIMETGGIRVGDEVFVKLVNASCTTQWRRAVVSGIRRPNQVKIDGIPYHVSHVRRVPLGGTTELVEKLSELQIAPSMTIMGYLSDSSDNEDEQPWDRARDDCESDQLPADEMIKPRPQRTVVRPAKFAEYVYVGVKAIKKSGTLQCLDSVCVCALKARESVI